jgi:putative transposase
MASNPPQRKHLRRLRKVHQRIKAPMYFISVCSYERREVLAEPLGEMITATLSEAAKATGWMVGRYVIMPDHVHFFCAASQADADISEFVGHWKSISTRRAWKAGFDGPLWQKEFVDHLLRSGESYKEKWEYVRMNPVEKGLCMKPEDWPFQGEIDLLT